jgi:uncharacterized metal-binding protein
MPDSIESLTELTAAVRAHHIGTLVCGGIREETRSALQAVAVEVIDNVACSSEEAVAALRSGGLRPGFGFSRQKELATPPPSGELRPDAAAAESGPDGGRFDCLACRDRLCLRGGDCTGGLLRDLGGRIVTEPMLEAATDIAWESERRLCRLAELVYFALEMGYRRIGIAYCVDLEEPSAILANVLGRFFEVVPVCCKVGGVVENVSNQATGLPPVACNPSAQARVLNHFGTDLNVNVGLCIGADCIMARESEAPVTTLFVKDRSLANNPIGALYSEYYLRESLASRPAVSGAGGKPGAPLHVGGTSGEEERP